MGFKNHRSVDNAANSLLQIQRLRRISLYFFPIGNGTMGQNRNWYT